MSSDINSLGQFIGHFHPMLVHLPVGGLVVLGALELLATFPRFKAAAQSRRTIVAVVTAGAVVAATCGWLLAAGGGYDSRLLDLHRWTGISVAGACVLTLVVCGLNRLRAYRIALAIALVLLVV